MVFGLLIGAGYRLCGQRQITEEEYFILKKKLKGKQEEMYVGTYAPTILWMPLFPVETIFYVGKVGFSRFLGSVAFLENCYRYKSKKRFFYKVYGEHIKSKNIFFALPMLILAVLTSSLFLSGEIILTIIIILITIVMLYITMFFNLIKDIIRLNKKKNS